MNQQQNDNNQTIDNQNIDNQNIDNQTIDNQTIDNQNIDNVEEVNEQVEEVKEAVTELDQNESNKDMHEETETVHELSHEENQANKNFNMLVQESIDSGITPIEIEYYPIIDLDDGFPIAYRTKTVVNSIIKGTLLEDEYSKVIDYRDSGVELLKRSIKYIIKGYKLFAKEEREIEYISVRCPSAIIEKVNLYETIKQILDDNKWFDASKLCLEFPADLLEKDPEKAKYAILDMKILHVKTAILDCGEKDFNVAKLIQVPVDYAYLDPSMTEWAGSRDKPRLLVAFVNYLKSMNVIAIGVGEEQYRKSMRSTDAIGFYRNDTTPRTLEEAVGEEESD